MRRPLFLQAVQAVSDGSMAALALALSYWFRFHVYPSYIPGGEPPDPGHYLAAVPVLVVSTLTVFGLMKVYRYQRGIEFIDELFSLVGAMAVNGLVVLALIGLYRDGPFTYSRLTSLYWIAAATLMVVLARYTIRRYMAAQRKRGIGADRALVVGDGAAADLIIQRIRMFPDYGYRVVGVLADGPREGSQFNGVKVLGTTGDLRRVVTNRAVAVVFVALPEATQDSLLQLMESCLDLGTDFRIVPSMLELMTTQVTADHVDGIPLLTFRHGLDIDGPKIAFKRAFDLVVAGLGLIVVSPFLLLIAAAVRLSSRGPVLLHQERVGLHGRSFRMLKFRTMREDAEVDTGPVWTAEADPRRTRVGRVLRRLSLDELPQLWNVVAGQMSLVGPRPERPVFVEEFQKRLHRYTDRHRVRPGLTGWAQVNDLRGQTPVNERLIYDLYYIENWSLAFDLKIILITLFRVFTHKNAY
jgi:exopolysaccharide biosynthesis polyprenyl glycosylphosphotransferase